MAYGGEKVLDLTQRLIDKDIKDTILELDITPEEKIILLEDYVEIHSKVIKLDTIRRIQ